MMNPSFRFVLCLAALFPARAALADEGDNDTKVDVVVDLTEAGEKVPRPSPAHPVYFYPVVKGYTTGEEPVPGQKPLPPTPEVQTLFVKALAQQGYRIATKLSPPSLLLMFWWGYKAPIFAGEGATMASSNSGSGQGPGNSAAAVNSAIQSGAIPTTVMSNQTEMDELVFGAKYKREPSMGGANIRTLSLNSAASIPRYYVTVSALDFNEAMQKNYVVLWTARMSTDLYGHTLEQVLPALLTAGAPMFGRDTAGPGWPFQVLPVVPAGHVEVGVPYVKTYPGSPAAPKAGP